jgi:hypothetical protein
MVKTSQEIAVDYSRSPLPAEAAKVPAECAGWRLDAAWPSFFPSIRAAACRPGSRMALIRIDGAVVPEIQGARRRDASRI